MFKHKKSSKEMQSGKVKGKRKGKGKWIAGICAILIIGAIASSNDNDTNEASTEFASEIETISSESIELVENTSTDEITETASETEISSETTIEAESSAEEDTSEAVLASNTPKSNTTNSTIKGLANAASSKTSVEEQPVVTPSTENTAVEQPVVTPSSEIAPVEQPVTTSPENIVVEQSAATPSVETPANSTVENSGDGNNFNTYNNKEQQNTTDEYILNTSTYKIHLPKCSSVPKISPQNYSTSNLSIAELEAQGYSRCGKCLK